MLVPNSKFPIPRRENKNIKINSEEKSRFILLNVCREDMWAPKVSFQVTLQLSNSHRVSKNYLDLKSCYYQIYTYKKKKQWLGVCWSFFVGGECSILEGFNWELLFKEKKLLCKFFFKCNIFNFIFRQATLKKFQYFCIWVLKHNADM